VTLPALKRRRAPPSVHSRDPRHGPAAGRHPRGPHRESEGRALRPRRGAQSPPL